LFPDRHEGVTSCRSIGATLTAGVTGPLGACEGARTRGWWQRLATVAAVDLRNRERDAAPFVTKDGSTIREYHHTDRQSLAEAALEPGTATRRHYHERAEEIYLIVEGGGVLDVGGDVRDVVAGDAIMIPPGAWHALTAGTQGVRLLCSCVPAYSDDDTYFA
jgi:mannose-6-phosphate isomerase-like protein (cupin superfamily)